MKASLHSSRIVTETVSSEVRDLHDLHRACFSTPTPFSGHDFHAQCYFFQLLKDTIFFDTSENSNSFVESLLNTVFSGNGLLTP